MLGKLLKHEFKATARLLLPLYIILLVLSIVDRIVLHLDVLQTGALALIPGIFTFVYVISIIGVIIVTFLLMITRFYKNLLTDEGYLMFTLPVKSHDLINSKLIVSIVWTIASIVGVVLSVFIVAATPANMRDFMNVLRDAMAELRNTFGNGGALLITEFIIMGVIALFYNSLTIYASIAIGQLFNGHKVIGSFAAYMGISTVLQILMTLIFAIIAFVFGKSMNEFSAIPNVVFPLTILIITIFSVVFYLITNYIFKRKLNLE
ncbi:MAG TPA: ABC transporter permease [Mobilitalea sp.]|nr:ABC transporter permease [Mobilitalea sp.]